MKLDKIQNSQRYVGLYIVDFDDHNAIGYTADEVAMLLESERYSNIKIYKIYNAQPDGTIELKAMPTELFQIEKGMFFHSSTEDQANKDFKNLQNIAISHTPPTRAIAKLAKVSDQSYITALIYPAEADDEISAWLLKANYKTQGPIEAGTEAVTKFYNMDTQTLDSQQIFSASSHISRTPDEVYSTIKIAMQR